MKFEFDAILSNDCEGVTFAVDEETFIRLMGRHPTNIARNLFHEGFYDIYPNDLLGEDGDIVNLKIEVTKKEDDDLQP